MNLLEHFGVKLLAVGVNSALSGDVLEINRGDDLRPLKIKSEKDWDDGFEKYRKARSISFDVEKRHLLHNTTFEVLVTRLAQNHLYSPEQYTLSDNIGNVVSIGPCSIAFSLSFLDSLEYSRFFEAQIRRRIFETRLATRSIAQMLWTPNTASYCQKGRKTPANFEERAAQVIQSCLFKIAVEQHDCMAVQRPRSRRMNLSSVDVVLGDATIPRARYDEDAVSFYKVAKASPFPSQSFLAYYHVMEFFFLRVAEIKLHDQLASLLNQPSLRADRTTLDKLISLIRGQDSRNDETEMLRNVLDRYIAEQDLITFIAEVETKLGEKVYSKRRKIFGEDVQVSLIEGHVIGNAAKVLKHIRNAIVHSSDKYKREDCHIPLSHTEELIEEFIPLIRFLSERVIYGSAT